MHVQLLSWRLQLLNAQNHVCEWGAKEVLDTNLKRWQMHATGCSSGTSHHKETQHAMRSHDR